MLIRARFLWVVFQIDSICAQKSDEAILTTLKDLPRDLPETFERILRALDTSEFSDPNFCNRIFKIVHSARRPLTLEELQEAASVEPGDIFWKPEKSINDIAMSLRSCGSFLTIDSDEGTVHFAHMSVKQYLSQPSLPSSTQHYRIDFDTAQLYMADIVVTYLSYKGKFDTQIIKQNDPKTSVPTDMVSPILANMMGHGKRHEMARTFLRSRGKAKSDVRHYLQTQSSPDTKLNIHPFLPYTQQFWLDHTRDYSLLSLNLELSYFLLIEQKPELDSVRNFRRHSFEQLIDGKCIVAKPPWGSERLSPVSPEYFLYACRSRHEALLANALNILIDHHNSPQYEVHSRALPAYGSVSLSLRKYYDAYTANEWTHLARSDRLCSWPEFLATKFRKQGVDEILVAAARIGYHDLLDIIRRLDDSSDISKSGLHGKVQPSREWPRIAINEAIINGRKNTATTIYQYFMLSDPDILEYEGPHGNARATAAHFGHQHIINRFDEYSQKVKETRDESAHKYPV